jgi:class 3 adenylate cyclase
MEMHETPEEKSGHIPEREQIQAVEMASVLFLDIVSYSIQPMDVQSQLINQLQQIVRGTEQVKIASSYGDLLLLPTGDGMAMVFFHNPIAPVLCAIEIARVLKQHHHLGLRMGIHSGRSTATPISKTNST